MTVIHVPEETYTCTNVKGIAELYAFGARSVGDPRELFVRRRPCVCDGCFNQPADKEMGYACTGKNVAGPWYPAPPMKYLKGNNSASVTRSKESAQQKRFAELDVGTWLATTREGNDPSDMSKRSYELSRITRKPEKKVAGSARKKDYKNQYIKAGQHWMVVDDYRCVDEDERMFEVNKTKMVCIVKPGDDIFINATVSVSSTSASSSSSSKELFKINSESHDNLQSMYQSSLTQGGGSNDSSSSSKKSKSKKKK